MGQSPIISAGSRTQWHATVVNTQPRHIVRLAVTPINQTAVSSRLTAYHTSICVDSTELSFDSGGICVDKEWASHRKSGGGPVLDGPGEVREVGVSDLSVEELLQAMRPHFQPGSYDILLKNCNTFSDCALSYLLGKRLDEGFSSVDRLARFAESNFGFIGLVTGYTPNPKAAVFVRDETIKHLKGLSGHLEKRVVKSTKMPRKPASEMASEKPLPARSLGIPAVKNTLEKKSIGEATLCTI